MYPERDRFGRSAGIWIARAGREVRKHWWSRSASQKAKGSSAHVRIVMRAECYDLLEDLGCFDPLQQLEHIDKLAIVRIIESLPEDRQAGRVVHLRSDVADVATRERVPERLHIFALRKHHEREPGQEERNHDEAYLVHREREDTRHRENRDACETAARALDEHVEPGLESALHPKRDGEVKHLHARLVDGVAKPVIRGLDERRGEEPRKEKECDRGREQRERQNGQPCGNPETAQKPSDDEQLDHEGD